MISLYWWRPTSNNRNFGDELSRMICEHFSTRWVEWAPMAQADLISVGSLLASHLHPGINWEMIPGTIWGSGAMLEGEMIPIPTSRIRALRGHHTRRQIGKNPVSSIALGDPGLLTNYLPSQPPVQKYALGLMPHWSDIKHPFFEGISRSDHSVKLINPYTHPDTILTEIQSCDCLLSSSLHGLVVADSYGIPNRWLRLDTGYENRSGSTLFKFRDYYSVFGMESISPTSLRECDSKTAIFRQMQNYRRPGLDSIQRELIESFPFLGERWS